MWPETREYDGDREVPFYEQLMEIPEGSKLFEVWGRDSPEEIEGSSIAHIGNIISKSPLTTSYFGDTRLFFEHEFMQ